MRSRTLLLSSLLAIFSTLAFAGAAAKSSSKVPQFAVKKTTTLGGEGHWDYLKLSPDGHRLFISRQSHVMVVDPATGKQIGDIPNTDGVHGIALAPKLNKGFTSDGGEDKVTVFDLKTLKVLTKVPTAKGPDAILYDPATERVFTMDGRAGMATAIDAKTNKPLGDITLGGDPEFAVADGHGHVYVNLESTSELVAIDSRTLKITKRWSLGSCQSPSGLAIDVNNRRLFSGCHSQVMAVSDPDQGKVVAVLPIGKGVDACRFDAKLGLAFSSNGDGTLTVIKQNSPDHYTVIQNLQTVRGARTMALDPLTHQIYSVTAQFGPPAPGSHWPSILPGTFELLQIGLK